MRDFKKLQIWQVGYEIASRCFKLTSTFDKYHKWGIGLQINKSGVSIPSNVAEGNSRKSEKDKKRYIEYALGSTYELETQLLVSQSANLGDQKEIKEILILLMSEQKMLMAFLDLLD